MEWAADLSAALGLRWQFAASPYATGSPACAALADLYDVSAALAVVIVSSILFVRPALRARRSSRLQPAQYGEVCLNVEMER